MEHMRMGNVKLVSGDHVFCCRELSELQRLLDLISVCPSKQQLPSLEAEVEKSSSGRSRQRHHGSHHQSTEALSLEEFRFVMCEVWYLDQGNGLDFKL